MPIDGKYLVDAATRLPIRDATSKLPVAASDIESGQPCAYCSSTPPKRYTVTFSGIETYCCLNFVIPPPVSRSVEQLLDLNRSFVLTQDAGDPCLWTQDLSGDNWMRVSNWTGAGCTGTPTHYDYGPGMTVSFRIFATYWRIYLSTGTVVAYTSGNVGHSGIDCANFTVNNRPNVWNGCPLEFTYAVLGGGYASLRPGGALI